ncbi:MAG: GNAT family N-acetyltransferase [Candidatus Cloacimonetes bacterium]|nr:GNAT family N-acetyltransferase [Candidatus Cloacimonadota bacterium]MCF7814089.1 GNAT family N-acetyltransferase [Candidatus Cloacimonadota bacterium]MCF7867982.1 GNAT family N-acetyltransferase [Candidatus Cloacimonadota bacterium]MCF7883440.1 GNAT family N-acetyltransferase [Candidatus Cloacimonadota bacterium]
MKIDFKNDLPEADQFYDLFITTGWNEDYKLTSSELYLALQNSYYVVCAYHKDEFVGLGRMLSDGIAHAVLFDVIVSPKFERNGIGSKIMKNLMTKCKELKIRDIQLFCADGKIEFYKKFGFVSRPQNAPGMEIRLRYK